MSENVALIPDITAFIYNWWVVGLANGFDNCFSCPASTQALEDGVLAHLIRWAAERGEHQPKRRRLYAACKVARHLSSDGRAQILALVMNDGHAEFCGGIAIIGTIVNKHTRV
jgi:hypothetical protein